MASVNDLTQAQRDALLIETGRTNFDGFDLDAHIAATGGAGNNGNPTNPTEINPSTITPIPLPEIGTPEYQALLLETGRSNLDGFNYAAHLAVKKDVSLSDFDRYFGAANGADLLSLLATQDVNQLMANASSSQVQALVQKFASDPLFAAYLSTNTAGSPNVSIGGLSASVAQFTQTNSSSLPLPRFGSDAYKALLLETGRSDLVDFNYAAHLTAKINASLANFDSYLNAPDGTSLLQLLGTNVSQLMAQASPDQVQQLVAKFANDPVFKIYLDNETKVELPAIGTPAYQALLVETGRSNLDGFDYDAHLKALTEARQLIERTGLTALENTGNELIGSAKGDKIIQTNVSNGFLAGGDGADKIFGNIGNDILIGGSGADQMSGGKGDDTYYFDDKKDKAIESNKGGTDTVVSEITIVLSNHLENILLSGGDISATGNGLINTIIGSNGNNIINGGLGNDTLVGGGGQDTFLFNSKLGVNNIDIIADFNNDLIRLDKNIFKALNQNVSLQNIVIGNRPQDANDYLIYNTSNNGFYYDPDGSGPKAMVCFATFIGSIDTTILQSNIEIF